MSEILQIINKTPEVTVPDLLPKTENIKDGDIELEVINKEWEEFHGSVEKNDPATSQGKCRGCGE